jgi:hydrogenase maturation protein HypF
MSEQCSHLVQIWGLVQGVGMRPFIYKTAKLFNLTGFVKNKGASVIIHISGEKNDITDFINMITLYPPSNARIEGMQETPLETKDYSDFSILNSSADQNHQGLILPDLSVCEDCLMDIKNSGDRRFQYAFTNCTNCGPRYSIISNLPYDRINTSMKPFPMCSKCKVQYENPEDRRFHAQPNCCPHCGPQYRLLHNNGIEVPCENSISKTTQLLKEGKIIAIKGIGGYHLVCDAMNKNAIKNLRHRKNRPDKPFAIMGSNIGAVKKICTVSSLEEEILSNSKRPIVLLHKSIDTKLPELVAPRLIRYGVMLPYSPLHHLIFDDSLQYLIMTSGNISGMPICYKDTDALTNLNKVADYFLIHNREIMTPVEDSVVRVLDHDMLISRCGRGYAPTALSLNSRHEILALGGQQKCSICIVHKGYAHVSQYLNTLNNMDACNEYIQVIKRLSALLKSEFPFVAHDLNPDYFSTEYSKKLVKENLAIQHHHAHMVGCMAEHNITEDVIGIIYDGTGLGTDGAVWGGEFLIGARTSFKRVGHLAYVPLQGGDSVIKEPWKCASSYLYSLNISTDSYLPNIDNLKLEILSKALQNRINCFNSSSMGRLFDCISALILHRTHITYDAQAAIELESILDSNISDNYHFAIDESESDETLIIGYKDIIEGVLADLGDDKPVSTISAKFHNTICKATIACAVKIRKKYDINNIVLSGGVFENTYLLKSILHGLREYSFNVYFNQQVPINDGGLSFGQAAAAASMIGR